MLFASFDHFIIVYYSASAILKRERCNGMEWSGRTEYVSVVIVDISYTFFSSFELKTRLSIWQEKRKKYPFHCYFDTQHKCTNVRLNNYRDSFSPYYAIFVFFAIINFVVNKHRSVFLSVRQITIFYSCHLDKRFFQFEKYV